MILVVGGLGSGKRAFAESLGYGSNDISSSIDDDTPVLCGVHEVVRAHDGLRDVSELADSIASRKSVVLLDDVGSGIVPLDSQERAWRDQVGLLGRKLAERADTVVRMVCGIPSVLKGDATVTHGLASPVNPSAVAESADDAGNAQEPSSAKHCDGVDLVIMRHGTSTYNEERRYAGWTDVALSERGKREAMEAGVCPQVETVYVSPLLRARQTAAICFPNARQVVVDGLQEMNFGDFEGRTAAEMENDAAYRAWVDGMCTARCPNGEGQDDMIRRMERAVRDVVHMAQEAGQPRAIIVAHGGTIMAAFTGVSGDGSDYFGWQVGNCEGYRAHVVDDGSRLHYHGKERFHDLAFLHEMACGPADGNCGTERRVQAEGEPAAGEPDKRENPGRAGGAEAKDRSALPEWAQPHRFFQNRECKHFPCHEGVPEDEFNCLYCYCPLYALGSACGGAFTYTAKGRKNCTHCALPHVRDHGSKMVREHYEQLASLASMPGEGSCDT